MLPSSWTGSVKIESTGNVPLAVTVTNANSVGGYDFSATGYGSRLVVLPYAAKAVSGRSTGYTLRNISGGTITVMPYYYNNGGTLVWRGDPDQASQGQPITLLSGQVAGRHQASDCLPAGSLCLPTSWLGTVFLEGTGNFVAIMREDTSTSVSGYSGVSR